MGKLSRGFFILTGIMILFYFGGLLQECSGDYLCTSTTPNSVILNTVLKFQDAPDSTTAAAVAAVVGGLIAIATIAVGFVTKNFELALVSPFAVFMFNLGWDILFIANKLREAGEGGQILAIIIFGPLVYLWLITIVEWWRSPTT